MADVVNLNRFRKRKRRESEEREADRNRVVHGQTKADKRLAQAERSLAERGLTGHERDRPAAALADSRADDVDTDEADRNET